MSTECTYCQQSLTQMDEKKVEVILCFWLMRGWFGRISYQTFRPIKLMMWVHLRSQTLRRPLCQIIPAIKAQKSDKMS